MRTPKKISVGRHSVGRLQTRSRRLGALMPLPVDFRPLVDMPVDGCTDMRWAWCCTPLESSRRGGHSHAYRRGNMPSADADMKPSRLHDLVDRDDAAAVGVDGLNDSVDLHRAEPQGFF